MIAALAAVAIGVAAIVVAVIQVRIMREEQHASVWPRLVIGSGYTPGKNIVFVVHNAGIGPALVKSVTASVDGRPVRDWSEAFQSLIGERGWSGSMSSVQRGLILSAGQEVTAFRLVNAPFIDRLFKEMHRLRFDVCYCSVYDRCWVLSGQEDVPEPTPVRTCTRSKHEFG